MDNALNDSQFLDAEALLRTDQSGFGTTWRYELVRGTIVAHAAPSPERSVIHANLIAELHSRLRSHPECQAEIGSGAVPAYAPRHTARIHDAMIRCARPPRVLFEVVSPLEPQLKRQWDQMRSDLQAVEGVREIVEIFQDETLVHACRRRGGGWTFEWIAGPDAELGLPSIGLSVPLAALSDRVPPAAE